VASAQLKLVWVRLYFRRGTGEWFAALSPCAQVWVLIDAIKPIHFDERPQPDRNDNPGIAMLGSALKWLVQNLTVIVPTILAAIGGAFALWRWREDQKWRRVQYAQTLIEKFFDDPTIADVCQILDTIDEFVTLRDEEDPEKRRDIRITDEFLQGALSTFCQKIKNTDDEYHIRHLFDRFFDGLSKFQNHIDIRLIELQDVKPYLEYWIIELSGNGKIRSETAAHQFRRYLDCFGYKNVVKLAQDMGHPIPKAPEPESLPHKCYCDSKKRTAEGAPAEAGNETVPSLAAERP
jgi:hypothetical protein